MSATAIGIIGLLFMLWFIFSGMNIAFAFLTVGFVGFGVLSSPEGAIGILRTTVYSTASNYNFCVILFFILMGNAVFAAGVSKGLFHTGAVWLSRLPGSLACATIAACAGFSAVCGSVIATTATMAAISIPEMRKHGYSDMLSTGCVAAGSGLGILLPPSTAMIVYGITTGESIGQLFAAGIGPGILLTVLMVLVIVVLVKLFPSLGPKGYKCAWKERFEALKGLIEVIVLFGLVFGGMFGGVFTVNEAAAVGAFLGLGLMLVKGTLNRDSFFSVMKDTVKTSSMTFLMLIGAMVMNNFLALTQMPAKMAAAIGSMEVSRYVIFAIMILIYMVLGAIMDEMSMILLTVPIFYPVMINLGFDGVWFGAIIILVMCMGLILPPVGMSCFIIAGMVREVPLTTIYKGSLPFLAAQLGTIALITVFPQIALWLPTILYSA